MSGATPDCTLEEIDASEGMSPELAAEWAKGGFRSFFHEGGDCRPLIITLSTDHYSLEQAWEDNLGIRTWRHIVVSIQGALKARLADQKQIGRVRRGGERSPAPLPDWYELAHVAYDHWREFGINPAQGVWQYLPAPGQPMLNIAEALHLRQPV